tara:strand:- start:343 stop:930 length:588 start_codon:yes stop_codon:yes gene_type:complete
MILDSLLSEAILFTSFAMRTPNVQPNPDDYEFSLGISNDFFDINRQWERELGNKYVDDIVWLKYESNFYLKPEYLDKQSKSVKYLKLDWRKTLKYVNFGFTTRSDSENLNTYTTFFSGQIKKAAEINKWTMTGSFDGYLLPKDENDPFGEILEYETVFDIKYKLTENISIYNLGQFNKLQGQQFYKAKIGLEFKL